MLHYCPRLSASLPIHKTVSEVRRLGFERERFGRRQFAKPVEEGKEYEVDIQETSRRGEGIARVRGFVIFVPNTRPGEHVKIRVTSIGNRFATAEVVGSASEPGTANPPSE